MPRWLNSPSKTTDTKDCAVCGKTFTKRKSSHKQWLIINCCSSVCGWESKRRNHSNRLNDPIQNLLGTFGGRQRRQNSLRSVWRHVDIRGKDECWPWTARTTTRFPKFQYGVIRFDGLFQRAHRVIWSSIHGAIPDGLVIRHACDNPRCCNPAHLLCGTYADNARDMVIRQRRDWRGMCQANAKLTDENIREIRRLRRSGMMLKDIAPLFEISIPNVGKIANGQAWSHVPDLKEAA